MEVWYWEAVLAGSTCGFVGASAYPFALYSAGVLYARLRANYRLPVQFRFFPAGNPFPGKNYRQGYGGGKCRFDNPVK